MALLRWNHALGKPQKACRGTRFAASSFMPELATTVFRTNAFTSTRAMSESQCCYLGPED